MPNALSRETSPYLLQHADNPVDWHAWDAPALALASRTGKPILLSIGYSACHWCHVMAHESFEDDETAEVMNSLYVNIKVDREERPDLDRIYQMAQQVFAGRPGGWPLTVFLTPDEHLPIFAGTYFPKRASYGMPAFKDVLERVEAYFRNHAAEIRENGAKLIDMLDDLNATAPDAAGELGREPLDRARQRLGETFDSAHGGFGDAPKFPHPTHIALLLARWDERRRSGDSDTGAATMIERTLGTMASRGLYDHLGGGFYRYCVDREWVIPHFEKMLYDNAQLLAAYADAYAAFGRARERLVASETADWTLRDMTSPGGAFFATLDADSPGGEGAYYVWTPAELDAALDADEAREAKEYFGLRGPANFEGHAWHLRVADDAPPRSETLESARAKLLAVRDTRPRPGRDDKVLVAWNGLMVSGLAKAARRLPRPELADAARRAVDFLRAELWRDGRLMACYKDGRARFDAYLDDYAFLGAGLIELLQCTWRSDDLRFACDLADVLIARFADPGGGFFFTADDHEALIHRPKPLADESIPAGNGVAALLLDTLGHLLGEHRYLEAAERTLRAALPAVERYPEAHATLLAGIERRLRAPELVVVRGTVDALERWRAALDRTYHAHRLVFCIPDDVTDLPGLLAERAPAAGPVAYVCTGMTCRAPIRDLETLAAALDPASIDAASA